MKKLLKKFRYGEKGFTLIELLVVVAILGVLAAVLGVLAAVAVPNVGKFIGQGKEQSYDAELHNVVTATVGMMADSGTATLVGITTDDMDLVVTTDAVPLLLSMYMAGLDANGLVQSGCTYTFEADGTVTQASTP